MNRRVRWINYQAIALLSMVAMLVAAIGTRAAAQTPPAAPPLGQHFEIMMLHVDQASQALAQAAADRSSDARVKALARQVAASRTAEIQMLTKVYQERYGATPAPWPHGQGGYGTMGPQMMGNYGGGSREYGGYGYGMMGVPPSNLSGKALDRALVARLARQDAMAISMATMALELGDDAARTSASAIMRQRSDELKALIGALP